MKDWTEAEIEQMCVQRLIRGGIPKSHISDTFDTFEEVAGTAGALRAAEQLADNKANFSMLILQGGYGCGKTHLIYATAHEFAHRTENIRVATVYEFLSKMKMEMQGGNPDAIMDAFKRCEFLGLDELGWHYDSGKRGELSWAEAQVQELVNYRYAHEMPTIITINCDFEDIPDRLQSRFNDKSVCTKIKITAGDFRPQKSRREQVKSD